MKLCVPDATGLRIRSSSSPLGSNNFADQGLANDDNVWTRPGFEVNAQQIELQVSANLGSVTLNPEGGCG